MVAGVVVTVLVLAFAGIAVTAGWTIRTLWTAPTPGDADGEA